MLRYDEAPLQFTDHAVEQANRRHFRHLDLEVSASELYRLAADHGVISTRPEWIAPSQGRGNKQWLILDKERLAFPLTTDDSDDFAMVALTCHAENRNAAPVGATVRWKT